VSLYTAPPEGSVVVCLDEMARKAPRVFLGTAWGDVIQPGCDGFGRGKRSTMAAAAGAMSSEPSCHPPGPR